MGIRFYEKSFATVPWDTMDISGWSVRRGRVTNSDGATIGRKDEYGFVLLHDLGHSGHRTGDFVKGDWEYDAYPIPFVIARALADESNLAKATFIKQFKDLFEIGEPEQAEE